MSLDPFTPSQFSLLQSDSASSYGLLENLLVVAAYGPPDVANARLFTLLVKDLSDRNPKGAGVLLQVQPSSTPTPDGRDALIEGFRALRGIISFAFVLESTGFATAAQRAIISAALFVTPYRDSIRVDSSLEGGMSWLCSRVQRRDGASWDVPSLQRAARAFCSSGSARRQTG